MPPHKWRRACTPRAALSTTATLPEDLILEIAARSDAATLFHCAAVCRLLRREILSPAFVGRVCRAPDGVVPPRLLGLLGDTFYLVRPATQPAASFTERSIGSFVSRSAGDLRTHYWPHTSRGGLIVLEGGSDMCVYDPMTGARTFLPAPPGPTMGGYEYVLLTTAAPSGQRHRLLLLAARRRLETTTKKLHIGAKPLVPEYVLTYDVGMAAVASHRYLSARELRLGSTPDGKLRLFGQYRGFTVCSWVLDTGGHDGWSPRAKVDTLPKLMSLSGGRSGYDYFDGYDIERFFRRYDDKVEVEGVGDLRSGVAVLRLANLVFILDMDTREICRISGGKKLYGLPLVVDLPSRLSTVQIF
ncbi:unnamed protein product [Urochloa decumbens]|uniref:F-box domain-containing protein n=1 Tax=Urochloa decumbens TaxID=240449 RepID=A0ABC8XFJ1_9POAL